MNTSASGSSSGCAGRKPGGEADEKDDAPLDQRDRGSPERLPEHDLEPRHRCHSSDVLLAAPRAAHYALQNKRPRGAYPSSLRGGEVRSGLGNRPDAVLLFDEINISVIASDRRVILGLKQWD
jgi:hypothetical protein